MDTRPKKKIGKPFQKGNKLGKGRPKTPEELRILQDEDRVRVLGYLLTHGKMTQVQLEDRLYDPNTTILERIVGCICFQAAKGSLPHAKEILDRTIGPPPKIAIVENISNSAQPVGKIPELDTEKLLALMLELKADPSPDNEPCKLIQNLQRQSPESLALCLPQASRTVS